jgi:hypothetical protein
VLLRLYWSTDFPVIRLCVFSISVFYISPIHQWQDMVADATRVCESHDAALLFQRRRGTAADALVVDVNGMYECLRVRFVMND